MYNWPTESMYYAPEEVIVYRESSQPIVLAEPDLSATTDLTIDLEKPVVRPFPRVTADPW